MGIREVLEIFLGNMGTQTPLGSICTGLLNTYVTPWGRWFYTFFVIFYDGKVGGGGCIFNSVASRQKLCFIEKFSIMIELWHSAHSLK